MNEETQITKEGLRQAPNSIEYPFLSILSLILSVCFIVIGPFGSVAGIICGRIALKDFRRKGIEEGAGTAKAAIGIGWAGVIVTVLGILIALAVGTIIWVRAGSVWDGFMKSVSL